MKKIALAALFALVSLSASAAQSALIASMPNEGGGHIELYSDDVPAQIQDSIGLCQGRHVAKTWTPTVPDAYGCWSVHDDTVEIAWLSGSNTVSRTYLAGAFNLTKEAYRRAKRNNPSNASSM